jgi:hypothetical protein
MHSNSNQFHPLPKFMKKSIPSIFACAALVSSAQGAIYLTETFNYTVGNNLVGSGSWVQDAAGTALTIASGSLNEPTGYADSTNNRVQIPSSTGHQSAQIQFDTVGSNDLYVSYLFRLDGVGTMADNSWSSFSRVENTAGTTNGLGLFLQKNSTDGTKFDIGIHKRANGGSAVEALAGLSTGTVYLAVMRYNLNGDGTDSMDLWINPSSSSYGGTAPTVTFSSTAGTDTTAAWTTFVIDPANAGTSGFFDELRVGTTWAEVVPAIPEPRAALLGGLGLLALLRRRRD